MAQVAKWLLENQKISLVAEDGRKIFPNAKQIYATVFSGVGDIDDLIPDNNISAALHEIIFSRFPAIPAIRISGTAPNPLKIDICLKTEFGLTNISESPDQIILSNKWFPVDLDNLKEARSWLVSQGMVDGESINFGQLIKLRSSNEVLIEIVDETMIDPTIVAQNAGQTIGEISGLNAKLYKYQKDGIAFLQLISKQGIGCILADEMGLGKTMQIIGLLQLEKNKTSNCSLIIAPSTILENWRREILQFAPTLKVLVHSGSGRGGVAERFLGYDIIVSSYETVVRDEQLMCSIKWGFVVLDEAQAIKNPDALRTKSIKKLNRRVSIAVTGTPVENKLEDLWSIADFSLPSLLGDLDEFKKKYENDIQDAAHLGTIVSPILLRRRLSSVAQDLPPKIEIPQPVIMGNELIEAYKILQKQTLKEMGSSADMVAIAHLRMVCTHPSLLLNWNSDPSYKMSKYQRLLEILLEIFESNEKVIIFTSYQGMVDLFMRDIPMRWKNGFFKFIDGRIPVGSRQITVDQFYEHKGFGALFLNPQAAGTGLNITAANHVIHYNPEWNPALTDQATGRAYRRKQERPVTVHHLYFLETIEETIVGRSMFKRELAKGAVVGNDGFMEASEILKAVELAPLMRLEEE